LPRDPAGGENIVTMWYLDMPELVKFARWLYDGSAGRRYLVGGADMLDFFDSPRGWLETRLSGDLRGQYEKETAE